MNETISIIIPTLNEANRIRGTIELVIQNAKKLDLIEIIVADGGSNDQTASIVQSLSKVKLIVSEPSRALQMNAGAAQAQGEILYFLHADSLPPFNFDQTIRSAFGRSKLAGCFRLKFDHTHPWLQLAGWLTRFNFRFCRGGDQSLYIKKSLFFELGGFNPEHKICEDLYFIDKIYDVKSFDVLPDYILTSSRNYRKHGLFKTQFHFGLIRMMRRLGVSHRFLYRYYSHWFKKPN